MQIPMSRYEEQSELMRIIHPEWRITSLPIPITLPPPPSPPQQQQQQQRSRRLNNDSGDFKVSSSNSSRNDDGDSIHKDRRRLFGLAKDYHLIRSKGGIYNDDDEVGDDGSIYSLSILSLSRSSFSSSFLGTSSGVYLHASLQVATQCQAFVGKLTSRHHEYKWVDGCIDGDVWLDEYIDG